MIPVRPETIKPDVIAGLLMNPVMDTFDHVEYVDLSPPDPDNVRLVTICRNSDWTHVIAALREGKRSLGLEGRYDSGKYHVTIKVKPHYEPMSPLKKMARELTNSYSLTSILT